MDTYRIEVGRQHRVKPGNIVGAIANEAGLDFQYIGNIDIQQHYSLVDLPKDMPEDVFLDLKQTRVMGQKLNISMTEKKPGPARGKPNRAKGRKKPESRPKKRKNKPSSK